MHRIRSSITPAVALCAGLFSGTCAFAQGGADSYPDKPVTLVVPTAAAGGTDTVGRLFAEALGKELKQTFIVDNKPGANGILGAESVVNAPADGYKLLFGYAAAVVVNPSLYRKLSYQPMRDFAPVAQIGLGGNLMLVKPDLPVKTPQEFVAYAKARPGKLSYCSWGIGSGGHLAMESLVKQSGIDIVHVPYKGTSPCMQDLIGGRVDAAFGDTSSTMELIKAGRIRVVAYSGPSRLPALPDVPTLNEAGYPFKTYSWYGILAPAKTPPAIVRKLNVAVNKLLKDPAMVKRMAELNMNDLPANTPEQFAATIQQDQKAWAELIRQVGVSLD